MGKIKRYESVLPGGLMDRPAGSFVIRQLKMKILNQYKIKKNLKINDGLMNKIIALFVRKD